MDVYFQSQLPIGLYLILYPSDTQGTPLLRSGRSPEMKLLKQRQNREIQPFILPEKVCFTYIGDCQGRFWHLDCLKTYTTYHLVTLSLYSEEGLLTCKSLSPVPRHEHRTSVCETSFCFAVFWCVLVQQEGRLLVHPPRRQSTHICPFKKLIELE